MATTMLGELLGLKQYRENKAEAAVGASRFALAQAAQLEQQAGDTLADYRGWSERHERALYADVCRRTVRPSELERLREDVNALRVREGELEQLLQQAAQHRGQAETALQQVRGVHEHAVRAREKFVQLVGVEAEAARLEAERQEDVETEDRFTVQREREEAEVGS